MADRSLLARATEGTIAPTPGYLYLDIAKNVATSPMACQEVATYLSRRLQSKQNPNIKYKCLKVIAKVAESPITRGMFKRTMAQDNQSMACIKEALQFRGPPDPARGDEPYQKVRTAAKEAMDAIYSDAPTSTSHAGDYSNPYGAPIGGHAGPSSTKPTSTRMEGIGNPMFKDPRTDPSNQPMTAETFLREAAEAVTGMIKDPLARNVDLGPPSGYGARPGGMPGYGGGGTYPPGRSQLAQSTGGEWTMASNRGPQAVNPPANFQQDSAYYKQKQAYDWASKSASGGQSGTGGVGGSWGAPSPIGATPAPHMPSNMNPQQPHIGMTSAQTTHGHGGTAVSDGQFEKQLVMELCPPGGLKAEPPPDKLQKFVQSIPSLDADLVCPALLDCLEEGQPWIIRAKALCVMEACITVGVGEDGVNKYADFFYECRAEIDPLSRHARPAVREPAQRVMALLGLLPSDANRNPVSAPTTANAFPRPVAAPPAPAADLLDFGDTPAAAPMPPVPPPAVPPSPPTQHSGGALFGGLKVQDKVASAPTKTADPPVESLLQAMTVNEVPAAQAGSGFGFMQAAEPAAPPAGSAFGFMQASEPAAPTTGSSFDFMQGSTAAAPAGAPSSSFDFMQSSPPNAAGEVSKGTGSSFNFMQVESATLPSSNPTNATFDPLAQNYKPSPTTQKQMMAQQQQPQLNPAQLQAMYAQQLMMQQQMQQMQFAMAMQQQQQVGGVVPMPGVARNNSVMAPGGFAATNSFSFLDKNVQAQAKKKEDKQFDFVQDAIKKEQK